MNDLFYDKKNNVRLSLNQLKRKGLLNSGVSLESLGIIPLVAEHGLDTDIYIPVDSGEVTLSEDGNVAHVVYNSINRKTNPEKGFDLKKVLTSKVNQKRDEIFCSGFDAVIGENTHTFQTRGYDDIINWTTLLTKAKEMDVQADISVRTEANETVTLPAGEVVNLIETAYAFRTAIMANSWEIKDNIENATSDDDAITTYETGMATLWTEKTPYTIAI